MNEKTGEVKRCLDRIQSYFDHQPLNTAPIETDWLRGERYSPE